MMTCLSDRTRTGAKERAVYYVTDATNKTQHSRQWDILSMAKLGRSCSNFELSQRCLRGQPLSTACVWVPAKQPREPAAAVHFGRAE